MSASNSPTRAPSTLSASARLTAVVDLPTPPLPDATADVYKRQMISSVSELSEALELLRSAQAELQEEGVAVTTPKIDVYKRQEWKLGDGGDASSF